MSKIKIISDSTADIPKNLQQELGIEVFALPIIDGDKEYLDGVSITNEEFYKILEESDKLPSSSRVAPGSFTDAYHKAWQEGYTDLIYVCLNSKGSSTYQGAVLELEDFYDENPQARDAIRVHIIDSKTYSMAYGYGAVIGARMAKEGKSADEVVAAIKDWIDHSRILFVPLDLKCVKKSGRVSAAAAFVGDALGLKPVITFEDGESKVISKIRGEKKVIGEMLRMVNEDREPGSPYMIVSGSNMEMYDKFRDKVYETMDVPPACEYPIGYIIAINAGANVLGIIYRR